ncbi:hypothetical protein GPECTOR_10g939 [Gonium pectorale]|uniref:Uncharacterized protein n=1 Tax=Gonium pectorale TaxID=33097 RepID=A0A150GR74_GONPE|nr:hypothetical protein GPECTOR_10g939 [Gonium pectorale]|eukprot:KXZ52307.1 hypothetical protein GPECTOR_10g939 [Gonium pectorale]
MRSVLRPESGEALAAAIGLLARPPPQSPSAAAGGLRRLSDATVLGEPAGTGEEGEASDPRVGGASSSCSQRELVIHNDYGSLEPPDVAPDVVEAETDAEVAQGRLARRSQPESHRRLETVSEAAAGGREAAAAATDAAAAAVFTVSAEDGGAEAARGSRPVSLSARSLGSALPGPGSGRQGPASGRVPRGVGAGAGAGAGGGSHSVWLHALAPLRLTGLQLYGIGLYGIDLAALAELTTLRRLTLASAELSTDSLPHLAALPHLEELELMRCMPRRRIPHVGHFSFGAGASAGGSVRSRAGSVDSAGGGAAAAAEDEGELIVDVGQRALLELCMAAPRLRRLHVVRCAGTGAGAAGPDGPLGAAWVRRQLAALGPRKRGAGDGFGSVGQAGDATGADAGWPEVVWD